MVSSMSLALSLVGIAVSSVYETVPLDQKLNELVATEAVGWAVARDPLDEGPGPDMWFSTELGNGWLNLSPGSDLAAMSLLRIGFSRNNEMTMKILLPDSTSEPFPEWKLDDQRDVWETHQKVVLPGRRPNVAFEKVEIDLTRMDIELPDSAIERFPSATAMEREGRLMFRCGDFDRWTGTAFHIQVGEVRIAIRELADLSEEWIEMKSDGWCATNVVLGSQHPILGRAVLEQYDLILDARKRRILVSKRMLLAPNYPLLRYRLDNPNVWRWIPSRGMLRSGDFIFTEVDVESAKFDLLCLTAMCGNKLVPTGAHDWVSKPEIEVLPFGAVSVSETKSWEAFQLKIEEEAPIVKIEFMAIGYRMKLILKTPVYWSSMNLEPLKGGREPEEVAIPSWPPVLQDSRLVFSRVLSSGIIPKIMKWDGNPQLAITDDKRIEITADYGEYHCDREVKLVDLALDFTTELCAYRQVDQEESGYLFEPVGKYESSVGSLVFKFERGELMFESLLVTRLTSLTRADKYWSPNHRWQAAPEVKLDPETRRITITPSGAKGWEYSHKWEVIRGEGASLVFSKMDKKLAVPAGFRLTDTVWEFPHASGDEEGPTLSMWSAGWVHKDPSGFMILRFHSFTGEPFSEPHGAIYRGIPEASVDESGSLIVRSNGDDRFTFGIDIRMPLWGGLEIVFSPISYSATGSVPVVIEEPGERCPICLVDFEEKETVAETLCKHRFHIACLVRAETRNCPLCRGSL